MPIFLNTAGYGFYPSRTNIVTNGLRIYVDATNNASYPGSGSVWTDLSGNNNNLSVSASFSSSPIGTFEFRNTSVLNRASASYSQTADFTTELWLKWGSSTSGVYSRMTSFGSADNFEQAILPTGKLAYYKNNTSWDENAGNPTFVSGSWTQYASTKTGTTFKMYKDGALIRTGVFNNSGGTLFCVGNRYKSEINIPTEGIVGDISIVRVYNTTLTDAQILQNYNADKSKFGL